MFVKNDEAKHSGLQLPRQLHEAAGYNRCAKKLKDRDGPSAGRAGQYACKLRSIVAGRHASHGLNPSDWSTSYPRRTDDFEYGRAA